MRTENKDIASFKASYKKLMWLIRDTQKESEKLENDMSKLINQLTQAERDELVSWVEKTTERVLHSKELLWDK